MEETNNAPELETQDGVFSEIIETENIPAIANEELENRECEEVPEGEGL